MEARGREGAVLLVLVGCVVDATRRLRAEKAGIVRLFREPESHNWPTLPSPGYVLICRRYFVSLALSLSGVSARRCWLLQSTPRLAHNCWAGSVARASRRRSPTRRGDGKCGSSGPSELVRSRPARANGRKAAETAAAAKEAVEYAVVVVAASQNDGGLVCRAPPTPSHARTLPEAVVGRSRSPRPPARWPPRSRLTVPTRHLLRCRRCSPTHHARSLSLSLSLSFTMPQQRRWSSRTPTRRWSTRYTSRSTAVARSDGARVSR